MKRGENETLCEGCEEKLTFNVTISEKVKIGCRVGGVNIEGVLVKKRTLTLRRLLPVCCFCYYSYHSQISIWSTLLDELVFRTSVVYIGWEWGGDEV